MATTDDVTGIIIDPATVEKAPRQSERRGLSDAAIVAVLAAIAPTIASVTAMVVALRTIDKVEKVEHATNSMKDALVKAALLEGEARGKALEKIRSSQEAATRAEGVKEGQERKR